MAMSENVSLKSHHSEVGMQLVPKTPNKRLMKVEASENAEKSGAKGLEKILPLKFKYGPADAHHEKNLSEPQSLEKQIELNVGMETKPTKKINKIIISNKMRPQDIQHEVPKPSGLINFYSIISILDMEM